MSFDQYGNFRRKYSKIFEKVLDETEITYYNGIESKIQEHKNNSNVVTNCMSGDCNNGYGEYKFDDMTITGYFENGQANGYANQIFSNGDNYIGNFNDGKREGYGVYTWKASNTIYYGEWKNDKIAGYGYLTKDNITSEAGIYQDGKLVTNLGQDYLNKKVGNSCQGNCVDGYGAIIYNNQDSYIGFFKNGKPYKVGTRKWKANNRLYVGQFNINGEPTGNGHVSTLDYIYFGSFINGEVTGKAIKVNKKTKKLEVINIKKTTPSLNTTTNVNTNSNVGCVSGNCNNGYGEYKGQTYTIKGVFKNGKANGYGLQTYEGSGFYEGNFVNGSREGYGLYKWYETGSTYFGQWKNGKQNGYGYYSKNGKITEVGFYQEGKRTRNLLSQNYLDNRKINNCIGNCKDGFGTYFFTNGDTYRGFFSNGKKHYFGSYFWKNGTSYFGEYYYDKANGIGDESYKTSGTRYFGSFTNGQRDGFGVFFNKSRTVDSYGIWSNGTLITRY